MKPRTRHVHSIKERVEGVIGKGLGVMAVFPLSPSSMVWGYQNGCSLNRYLNKAHGWSVKMPWRVFRGTLLDTMLMQVLDHTEPNRSKEVLYETFYERKDEYDLPNHEDSYLEEVWGLSLILIERFKDEQGVYGTQQQIRLDLRDSTEGEPNADEYVNGYLDWTVRNGGGVGVRDLKCTSAKPVTKSLGKHSLQLYTYGSALWQEGLDVRTVGVEQLHIPSKRVVPCEADFSVKDYDRTVRIFRQAASHYRNVANGTDDFKIPYKGTAKCTQWSCDFFRGCPMGANDPAERSRYMV